MSKVSEYVATMAERTEEARILREKLREIQEPPELRFVSGPHEPRFTANITSDGDLNISWGSKDRLNPIEALEFAKWIQEVYG